MFKEFGQIMSLMKNMPKMQASMQEMQQKLGQISVEGNAGAGMVVVKVNGRMEVTSCVISDEAMKLNDRDMLADLIIEHERRLRASHVPSRRRSGRTLA